MPSSDRAFRALARERPDLVVALLERVAADLLPAGGEVTPESVDDPHLDPPPPTDADWVARVGGGDLVHVECQGYRETGFTERLSRYHLALLLRYPTRRVSSVALWVIRPPTDQREPEIEWRGVRVGVRHVVLADVPSARLLSDRRTVCFAAGADRGGWTDPELCLHVARGLKRASAGYRESVMAVALAATAGRYDAMVRAMKETDFEPLFIEELVRFGEDRGRSEGEAHTLLRQLRLKFGELPPTTETRVREASEADLHRWVERILTAESMDDVFE